MTCLRWHREEVVVYLQLIHDLSARSGWVVSATRRPIYAREVYDTHCVRGWVGLGGCLDGTENFVLTGIRYPDRPSCCEPLYRLRHLGLPEFLLLSLNLPVGTKENNEAHQNKRSSGQHWILGLSRYERRVLITRPGRSATS